MALVVAATCVCVLVSSRSKRSEEISLSINLLYQRDFLLRNLRQSMAKQKKKCRAKLFFAARNFVCKKRFDSNLNCVTNKQITLKQITEDVNCLSQ